MKIALSAGHYPQARGACYNGMCEHEQAAYWCSKIAQALPNWIEVFHVPTGKLPRKVKAINSEKCDIAVEVHFNACGGCGAEGAETLYYPYSEKGKELAESIQEELAKAGAIDRGVKEGWYKMDAPGKVDFHGDVDGDEHPDYLLEKTNCPAVIVEPEFIEMNMRFDAIRNERCIAIAKGIIEYLERQNVTSS